MPFLVTIECWPIAPLSLCCRPLQWFNVPANGLIDPQWSACLQPALLLRSAPKPGAAPRRRSTHAAGAPAMPCRTWCTGTDDISNRSTHPGESSVSARCCLRGSCRKCHKHMPETPKDHGTPLRSRPWVGSTLRRTKQKASAMAGFFRLSTPQGSGGRYRVRTCDPYHVKVVLYR